MSFTQSTFLGASIRDVQSSIGWNTEPNRLIVSLVEDPTNNDRFSPVEVGQPIYFQIGSYRFYGLLEKWTESKSLEGYPLFVCHCADPRALLQATKIILSGYGGSVSGVYNLLNVYGYFESGGFGNSYVTDSGMPWRKIQLAIHALTNIPIYGANGGPIYFKGYYYKVDLSDLPNLPPYFRVGGGEGSNLSLIDFVEIVCRAANYDFTVELIGFTIKVRTHARGVQPPLGTISRLVDSGIGINLISNENGLELRNETTSSFLVGAPIHTIYKGESYGSFWGYNIDDEPIIGSLSYLPFWNGNNLLGTVITESVLLYLPEVSDILGELNYQTTEFELRIVLSKQNGGGYSSWTNFLRTYRRDIYDLLELPAGGVGEAGGNKNLFKLFVDGGKREVPRTVRAANGNAQQLLQKGDRLYKALLNVASAYLGKKWAVILPLVETTVDVDTGVAKNSYDIANAGYRENDAENDLNRLPSLYYNFFQTPDGLFVPFAYYFSSDVDYDTIPTGNSLTVTLPGDLSQSHFVKCSIDPKIQLAAFKVDSGSTPAVLQYAARFPNLVDQKGYIRVPVAIVTTEPIFKPVDSAFGDNNIFNLINGGPERQPAPAVGALLGGQDLVRNANFGRVSISLHPEAVLPNAFHIPLKSNTLRYGPWRAQGAAGAVNYTQNDSINPWSYGSYANMNLVGTAFVSQEASTMQTVETGQLQSEGLPQFSLGDIMMAGGPNITRINIQFGERGVTTTYSFETYIPRYGQIGKYNIDRMRRQASFARDITNNARAEIQRNGVKVNAIADANRAVVARGVLAAMPPAIAGDRTPHTALNARLLEVDGSTVCGISTTTYSESLILSNADDYDEMTKGATTSLDGVFWPYQFLGPTGYLPYLHLPTGCWFDRTINNGFHNNPLTPGSGNIQYMVWDSGNEYAGAQAWLDGILLDSGISKRSIGLRGPLVLTGWGRLTNGDAFPSEGDDYDDDAFCNSNKWKTGPIDLLFDDKRKVWTSNPCYKGILRQNLLSYSGVARMEVRKAPMRNSGTRNDLFGDQDIYVRNWFKTTIPSGTHVVAQYVHTDNTYVVVAADCPE